MGEEARHSCLKLHLPDKTETIFVKATFFNTRFHLDITDGFEAWICEASEQVVKERAAQWDQPVSEYIELAEKYLGFQQPGSVYKFTNAGLGHRWEEVVSKTKSFERLKDEAENCLAQGEKFNNERGEFGSAIYAKFLGILNSKKAKLRELRDQLSKQGSSGKLPDEDEGGSTEKTETFTEGSDNDKSEEEITKNVAGTSKGRGRGRKRGHARLE